MNNEGGGKGEGGESRMVVILSVKTISLRTKTISLRTNNIIYFPHEFHRNFFFNVNHHAKILGNWSEVAKKINALLHSIGIFCVNFYFPLMPDIACVILQSGFAWCETGNAFPEEGM